jgi:predicted Zn-dependent protease
MLVFMFLFPVLYAAYKESMLYNGWRHWFFVYGNIVILAAWGWSWLIENRKAALRYAGTALVTLGCANMVWWMVRSHPNQYVYFNELTGGLKGAYGYYETDYYSNTLKQAAEWLCENEDVDSRAITVVTNNEPLTAQYYVDKYSDSVGILWTREYELSKKYADYAFFTTRTMSKTTLHGGWFPPKGTIHTIEVDGVPLCAIVKRENQYAPQAYEFIEKGEKDSAAHYFQLAIDHDPLNEELYRMLGMVYLNMGPEYMDSGYLALKKSIELLPENFIAYDMLGMYYMKKNNLVEAEKNFSVSISYKINYTNAHYNRGIALFNSGNYIEAVREFEASVRYGGHKPEFYKLLGLSQMNLGQLDKAIQMLNNSISLNASDPEVFDYLGQAYERKGDAANSANAYGRAFQLRGGQN